jgi:hypothetical protein
MRLLLLLTLLTIPALAEAQTCLGGPSFRSGPIQLTVGGSGEGSRAGVGADATMGWGGGRLITSVGGGYDVYINPDETRQRVGVLLGTQRRTEEIMEFCPFVSARLTTGSEFTLRSGGTARAQLQALGVGVGFGGQLAADRFVSIVPWGIVSLNKVTGRFEGVGDTEDIDVDETGGVFTFGLGFRFDEWVQVSPTISVSSFEGSDLVIGIRASIALQTKR